ncbi:MAG: PqqD family peptide modification chaperone [Candidatus Omnitrophota bacterium]
MMLADTSDLSRNPMVIDRNIGELTFILHPLTGEVMRLNVSAAFIWEALARQHTLEGIAHELSERFHIGNESSKGILREFLPKCYMTGLIKIDGQECPGISPVNKKAIHRSEGAAALWESATENNVPLKVDLELTHNCNLSCQYCYSNTPNCGNGLTFPQIKALITDLRARGCVFLTLTGGEPLIRTDILKIIEHARNENLLVRLLTNGTLITGSFVDAIAEIGQVNVEISLHHLDPLLHDRFTNMERSFGMALKSAQCLKEKGVEVTFKFTVTRDNFECLKNLKPYSQTIGIPILTNAVIIPQLDGSNRSLSLCLSDEQLREAISNGWITSQRYACVSGKAKCLISPEGDVYPCEFIRTGMGNLHTGNFDSIWDSEKFQKFRASDILNVHEPCKACECFSFCQQCPGLVYLEKGRYDDIFSQTCRIAQIAKSIDREAKAPL